MHMVCTTSALIYYQSFTNGVHSMCTSSALRVTLSSVSTVWSSITKVEMTLAIEHASIIYSMYRAGEVSVHRACCERATQPYSYEGGDTFDQAQDQQVVTTHSPRIVTECLLTRLMLIKMYVYAIYSRFRIGTILSISKHGYECITYHYTITIESDESFQS